MNTEDKVELLRNAINNSVKFRILTDEESEGFFSNISESPLMLLMNPLFTMASRCIKDYSGGMWDFVEFDLDGYKITAPVLFRDDCEVMNVFGGDYMKTDFLTCSLCVWQYALQLLVEKDPSDKVIDIFENNNELVYQVSKDIETVFNLLD